jgi:hypothetical protein
MVLLIRVSVEVDGLNVGPQASWLDERFLANKTEKQLFSDSNVVQRRCKLSTWIADVRSSLVRGLH